MMDFTQFADPQTIVNLLSPVFGPVMAKLMTAALVWMGGLRVFFKVASPHIQKVIDAFNGWLHETGNTEIHRKVETFNHRAGVRFAYWLLDYFCSLKLGSQRQPTMSTVITTITEKTAPPAQPAPPAPSVTIADNGGIEIRPPHPIMNAENTRHQPDQPNP